MLTAAQILLWTLVAIPFLILLAVLAGVAYAAYALRHSVHVASLSPCPKCGSLVGRAAVLDAKKAFEEKMKETQKQRPGIKLRTIAEWPICCPRCGATFYFYPSTNTVEAQSRFAKSTA